MAIFGKNPLRLTGDSLFERVGEVAGAATKLSLKLASEESANLLDSFTPRFQTAMDAGDIGDLVALHQELKAQVRNSDIPSEDASKITHNSLLAAMRQQALKNGFKNEFLVAVDSGKAIDLDTLAIKYDQTGNAELLKSAQEVLDLRAATVASVPSTPVHASFQPVNVASAQPQMGSSNNSVFQQQQQATGGGNGNVNNMTPSPFARPQTGSTGTPQGNGSPGNAQASANAAPQQPPAGTTNPFQYQAPSSGRLAARPTYAGRATVEDKNLPEFSPSLNAVKVIAHTKLSPWFINIFPVSSMRPRCHHVVAPVIDSLDKAFVSSGLVRDLQNMNKQLLAAARPGSSANPDDIINEFAKNNAKKLDALSADAYKIRKHVEDTYLTNAQRDGLTKDIVGWKDDLMSDQKAALIAYLKDMENLAQDIKQGTNGQNGTQILNNLQRIKNGELSLAEVQGSINGLSKSNLMANNSYARAEGKWPDNSGGKIYAQWRYALERSINEGIYNPTEINSPIPYQFLKAENLEATWLTNIMHFADRDENGNLLTDFKGDVEPKKKFVSPFLQIVQSGYGQEAVMYAKMLANLSQPEFGGSADWPMPTAHGWTEGLDAIKSKLKPSEQVTPDQQFWLDKIRDIIEKEATRASGQNMDTILGVSEKWFKDSRPNRHKAERSTYYLETVQRWANDGLTSKPEQIQRNRWVKYQIVSGLNYLAGAVRTEPGVGNTWGVATPDYRTRIPIWTNTGETRLSQLGRALIRPLSLWTLDDINKNPFKMPTKLGWMGITGGVMMGIGSMTNSPTTSSIGETMYEGATYPVRASYSALWKKVMGSPSDSLEQRIKYDSPDKENEESSRPKADLKIDWSASTTAPKPTVPENYNITSMTFNDSVLNVKQISQISQPTLDLDQKTPTSTLSLS